jgi:hypothetical protein
MLFSLDHHKKLKVFSHSRKGNPFGFRNAKTEIGQGKEHFPLKPAGLLTEFHGLFNAWV